jgi:hypothetical protein
MPDRGWQRGFDDPIGAPDGTRLDTLREAVAYLAKTVPKSERDMPIVTTATKMLTYAAEHEPARTFLARIATLQAIHRHEVRQFEFENERSDDRRRVALPSGRVPGAGQS